MEEKEPKASPKKTWKDHDPRTERVRMSLTVGEKKEFVALAKEAGLSESDYARKRFYGQAIKVRYVSQSLEGVKFQLHKIGVNIQRLILISYTDKTYLDVAKDLKELIPSLREAIKNADKLIKESSKKKLS